jgi:transposase
MKQISPDFQTSQTQGQAKAQAIASVNQTDAINQAEGPTLLIGIDWADENHAYHCVTPDGKVCAGILDQDPQAIVDWINHWHKQFPGCQIEICLETSRGALINSLLEHGLTVYPVNANALANYRKAFAHGGGKNDPVDAKLISQFLTHYRDQLKPLNHDQPLTRELGVLARDRRNLVEQRVALANKLTELLKQYFPAILQLNSSKSYAEFIVRLLLKYPTLEALQAAGRTKLQKFFFGVGSKANAAKRIDMLLSAIPLTTDPVILRTCGRLVQTICGQLQVLNNSIKGYDAALETLVKQHHRFACVAKLPNSGPASQARILAALGDDQARYRTASNVQAAAGIAPLTTQSGKSKYVSSRWACSKFMKQTFHEYAGLSITKCQWARNYYDRQIANGNSAQMAKRALAYKWIRIIFKLWQTNQPYDDARYTQRLKESGSPHCNPVPPNDLKPGKNKPGTSKRSTSKRSTSKRVTTTN